MKSLIEFPEEVATPSSPLPQKSPQTSYFDAIGFDHGYSEIDQSTSSTLSTESESYGVDSGSDSDENDVSYHDSPVDAVIDEDADETNNAPKQQRRSVSFGPIHVRQYERIVGDHPETKVGVPLAIGWAYYEDEDHPDGISIERYEADRIRRGKVRMSSITRKNMMLHVFKFPEEEIKQAEKRSIKLRKQREKAKGGDQTALKKVGKMIRKGGWSVLKGMSSVGQLSSTGGLGVTVDTF